MKYFEHGGNLPSKTDVSDFSVNLSPLGMPDAVRQAIENSAATAERYPDPHCVELTVKISQKENLDTEYIICGNGAADLIIRLCLFLKPKTALVTAPTFSEYEKAVKIAGGSVEYFYLNEAANFALTEDIISQIRPDTDVIFLCNPNNPTGQILSGELISKISERCAETDTFLVIDESFLEFTHEKSSAFLFAENKKIAIIKSLTKMYSMAGVRLGYLLCPDKNVIEGVGFCAQSWSVSSVAQAAGIAALQLNEYAESTRAFIETEREFLSDGLASMGVKVYPPTANFILCLTDRPISEQLLNRGIYIRNCENFVGLNANYFRVAVRKHDDNVKLLEQIKEVLNG